MSKRDLWGDLSSLPLVRTPKLILEEQAASLSVKTGGRLRAEVEGESSRGRFRYRLDLVASWLNDYRYTLLKVEYDVELFPVFLTSTSIDGPPVLSDRCTDEGQFMESLAKVLGSSATRRVMAALLSQMAAPGETASPGGSDEESPF